MKDLSGGAGSAIEGYSIDESASILSGIEYSINRGDTGSSGMRMVVDSSVRKELHFSMDLFRRWSW